MLERSIGDAFHGGLYVEVIRRTIDSPTLDVPDDAISYVVGALAFVGRLEEARLVFSGFRRRAGVAGTDGPAGVAQVARARSLVASRFFLGVAYARAGRHADAEREFRENLREAGAQADPTCRFYVAQGLGCLRYFRGLMGRASRHVRRSLAYAVEARFQYGRLLATDLRGHALVQTGQVCAGVALLDHAMELARSLGLAGNAGAIECAVATYRARFGIVRLAQAIETLEALARTTSAEDSYSRRIVELELAEQLAFAGRGDDAWARLEALSLASAPDRNGRAHVRFLLACAVVAELRYGLDSARTYVAEARAALAGAGALEDRALEVDVLCAELTLADPPSREAFAERLAKLHVETGISRAGVYAAMFGGPREVADAVRVAEFEEDRTGARLGSVRSRGAQAVPRLLREGYVGLVPLAVGATPEAAIIEVSTDRFVLAERGNVRVLDETPGGASRLLRSIARVAPPSGGDAGFHTKEALLAEVWGIGRYRPDRHDAIVHTAISRLRAKLGTSAHWIESRGGAYRLAPHVAFRTLLVEASVATPVSEAVVASPARAPSIAHDPAASSPVAPAATAPPAVAESDAVARERALLAHLRAHGSCSTTEAASALRVSEMTAFRTLRALLERGAVARVGKGRGTRYAEIDRSERGQG